MPTISWSGSTSSPRRAAKLVAVAIVSVSDTSVMPTAPTRSGPTSDHLVQGSAGTGTPWGSVPTVFTPWSARSSTAEITVTPTTATRTAGTPPGDPRQDQQHGQHAEPGDQRRPIGLVDPIEEGPNLIDEAVGIWWRIRTAWAAAPR